MGCGVGSSNAEECHCEDLADGTGYGCGAGLGSGDTDGTNRGDSFLRNYAPGSGHGFLNASGVGCGKLSTSDWFSGDHGGSS